MAEVPLGTGIHYFADPTKGKPVYFGSVYVGEPDLDPKILANRVSVILLQEDGSKVVLAPSAQPFVTGAGGQILYQGSVSVIKVTDSVSVRVDNQAGYQVNYNPRYNEADSITASLNEGAKPVNGSFEIENGAGIAANWLISVVTGSITVDTTESSHGIKSLKFTGIDATGAGTATSDKFNVQEGSENDIRFSYRSTAATTLNEVSVRYFDSAGAPVSIDTVHSDGATNPVAYTNYLYRSIAPATAVQADIFIDGVKSTGATTTASTYFDGIFIDYLTENEVVRTQRTPNSVNRINVQDAVTGNNPAIDVEGEDVGIDIEGVTLKNGVATGDLVGDVTASTVDVDTLTADTAGGDLELTRNGAGNITVDGTPIYGLVILDTPEVLVSADATKSAWTAVNSVTLNSAGAVKAIIRVRTKMTSADFGLISSYIRKTGTTLLPDDTSIVGAAYDFINNAGINAEFVAETVVNLDSSFDFDWQTIGVGVMETTIILVGYYT